jgi:subtilase family serine protease
MVSINRVENGWVVVVYTIDYEGNQLESHFIAVTLDDAVDTAKDLLLELEEDRNSRVDLTHLADGEIL